MVSLIMFLNPNNRCLLPSFSSKTFTLSTANRIFLKEDLKPKKRYFISYTYLIFYLREGIKITPVSCWSL